ncbi:L-2-hydroxyglutarate oxidase [Geoalkalibacter subterraneus]|jgi:L-2-hydroxyglutarate oxidase|uniref:Hydroxyglutarate oxidase n=1 Tax=Geoalkalibacter subterraneus TaxID=483547 RepID=A0A0B5FNC0_9BACT|nr:L-2-hydroxyglutarate oxidase [Geoalkalibacter subterraneus]AJF05490.1 hydroxyglutarate oxidase [Geoalkalibacter subterraneus]
MQSSFDIAVVGGGIVGLATALALSREMAGKIVVLEKEAGLARHQTGNNSGVIHSGLYYRPGSRKTRTCTEGREELYRFCREENIPCERCGKVVVATREEEVPRLEELERRGRENGLEGLQRLDRTSLREYEPHVVGIAGLYVPQTGIVDFPQAAQAMAKRVEGAGGAIRVDSEVRRVHKGKEGLRLETTSGEVFCSFLVNCAGLHSDRVARMCGADPQVHIIPFRGEYYDLCKEREGLVNNLIYPVPDPNLPFLGVHFTRMIHGGIEAGPNAVLALKREGYNRLSFSLRDVAEIFLYKGFWQLGRRYWRLALDEYLRSFSKHRFLKDLQSLLPMLASEDITTGGAGVRAQAVDAEGRLLDDFHIVEEERAVHVLNAPSPAATASLAIGRSVARRVMGKQPKS